MEDRWEKLRQIVEEALDKKLHEHGFTKKTKLGFINGKWTGVTEEQLGAWKEAYGLCDVEAELKKASAWIVSNPSLAPKQNYARFLNSWLARQQTTLSIRSIPTRNEQAQDTKKFCAYCQKPTVGSVNGIWHCAAHSYDAMDQKPTGLSMVANSAAKKF